MIESYIVYNFVLLFGAGLAFLSQYIKRIEMKEIVYFLSFLIVWLVAALRYYVGTDYPNYVYIFEHLNEYQIGHLEPLYHIINQFIYSLRLDVQWVFVITSFIITFFIYKTATYYHRGWFILFFILLFYFQTLTIVRQLVAMSIMVYGIHHLLNNSDRKFLFSTLFAIGFHYSALLLVPLYFLKNIKINGWIALIGLITIIIVLRHSDIATSIFSNPLLGGSKYGAYATNEFNRDTEIGSGIGVALQLLIPVSFIFLAKIVKNIPRYSLVLFLCLSYVASMILTLDIYIFNRVMVMYSICYLFAIAYIAKSEYPFKHLILLFLALGCLVLYEHTISIALYQLQSGLGITPYQSILRFL